MIEPVVLFVDDEPAILRAIRRTFRQSPLKVLTADNSDEALLMVRDTPVSVVVSDYSMPDRSGAEFLAMVHRIRPEAVRMILSGNSDQEATIDAINQGGVSRFLTKPWCDHRLVQEIDNAVAIWESRIHVDSDRKILTQAALLQFLDSMFLNHRPERSAVIVIALRNLRSLEDSLGSEALLRLLTGLVPDIENTSCIKLRAVLEDKDIGLFLDLSSSDQSLASAVQSLLNELPDRVLVDSHEYRLEYDAAYAECTCSDDGGSTLLDKARLALQNARTGLAGRVVIYDDRMTARRGRRSLLEAKLNSALSNSELTLHYQPKIALSTCTLHGAEALIRWNNDSIGPVSPAEFIPLTENNGLILEIGEWVIEEAVHQWTNWFSNCPESPAVSVNVSPKQLNDSRLLQHLRSVLDSYPIPPSCLELEITESMMVGDIDKVIDLLTKIRQLGIRLSIDDFGTGYSSLSYLSRLPVNTIKIDRSFILPMLESTEKLGLVRNLITLGHDLGMQLVAEGVENREQLMVLREFGCDLIQGYYFSPPLSADEFMVKTSSILSPQTLSNSPLSASSG